jgi:hypothetical protein
MLDRLIRPGQHRVQVVLLLEKFQPQVLFMDIYRYRMFSKLQVEWLSMVDQPVGSLGLIFRVAFLL